MICLGWNNADKFEYKTFMINRNSDEDEYNMINNMWEFIENKMIEMNKNDYVFIHWTNAEITFYNKFILKHQNSFNEFKSFDLYKLFLDNNIVVKGALNFSLKNIASAFHENKLINSCWEKSSCNNGLQAMYLAYNLYKNNNHVSENDMKDIIKYNIIDCRVMWEILSYLRNNY
jgi:predicted RecB family nuclease